MPRRDLKLAAMFLFAKQGKNRESGPGRNFRQGIDVGQIQEQLKSTLAGAFLLLLKRKIYPIIWVALIGRSVGTTRVPYRKVILVQPTEIST